MVYSAGALLGVIRALSGAVSEEILSTEEGRVLSWNDSTWLSPGSFVGTLAVPEKRGSRGR